MISDSRVSRTRVMVQAFRAPGSRIPRGYSPADSAQIQQRTRVEAQVVGQEVWEFRLALHKLHRADRADEEDSRYSQCMDG